MLFKLSIRESLDELEKANQKLKKWQPCPKLNTFKWIQKILPPSKFPIFLIHLAYTPLHIKSQGHMIDIRCIFSYYEL